MSWPQRFETQRIAASASVTITQFDPFLVGRNLRQRPVDRGVGVSHRRVPELRGKEHVVIFLESCDRRDIPNVAADPGEAFAKGLNPGFGESEPAAVGVEQEIPGKVLFVHRAIISPVHCRTKGKKGSARPSRLRFSETRNKILSLTGSQPMSANISDREVALLPQDIRALKSSESPAMRIGHVVFWILSVGNILLALFQIARLDVYLNAAGLEFADIASLWWYGPEVRQIYSGASLIGVGKLSSIITCLVTGILGVVILLTLNGTRRRNRRLLAFITYHDTTTGRS